LSSVEKLTERTGKKIRRLEEVSWTMTELELRWDKEFHIAKDDKIKNKNKNPSTRSLKQEYVYKYSNKGKGQ
jgi:hypothetical protein